MRDHEPLPRLQIAIRGAQPTRDFIGALRSALESTSRPGLIAEVKKASPSKGVICEDFDPVRVTRSMDNFRVHASCLALCNFAGAKKW